MASPLTGAKTAKTAKIPYMAVLAVLGKTPIKTIVRKTAFAVLAEASQVITAPRQGARRGEGDRKFMPETARNVACAE